MALAARNTQTSARVLLGYSFQTDLPEAATVWLDHFRLTLFDRSVSVSSHKLIQSLCQVESYLECLAALEVAPSRRTVDVLHHHGPHTRILGTLRPAATDSDSFMLFAYQRQGNVKVFEPPTPGSLTDFLITWSSLMSEESVGA